MSDQDRHLTASDFERLLNRSEVGAWDSSRAEAHAAECAQCCQWMESYRIQMERLGGLRTVAGARTSEGCPPADRLMALAAGLGEGSEMDRLVEHAATCDACGTLLRIAVEDLHSEEIPPAAEPAMAEPFRRRLVAELRQGVDETASVTTLRTMNRRLVWAAGAIAATILIFASASAILGVFNYSPEKLVVLAFEANRTWPLRFPGASHSALVSLNRSSTSGNTALAEADAAVSKGLDANPKDLRWLRLGSQMNFLRRRYDAAIAGLGSLASGGATSAELAVDLGIYHLARGIADSQPADVEKSVEYFSGALRLEPRNPVALFNRATAFERLFLWDAAAQDWKAYLETDASGGWAEEARERLRQVGQKKTRGVTN